MLALAATVALGACAVGPDFSRPPEPQVEQFVNGAPPAATLSAAGKAQAFRADAAVRDDWWTLFGCRAINMTVDEALTGNATLAAAQATLLRSEHDLRAGAGVFLPQADAQFSASRQKFSPLRAGVDLAPSIFNLFTLSATVSYALDIWGGERRAVEALAAQVDAQRYALAGAYLTLAANVVNTMIARAAYRDEIAATQETVALVDQQIAITNAQVKAGTSAYAALLTLENERATLQASVPVLAQKDAQAADLLALLSGQFPSEWQAQPVSLADITLPAGLPQTVPSSLVRRRPDILQAEAALHVASAGIGVATAALFPNLTLSASGGFDNMALHGLLGKEGQVWSVGAGLTAPLFQGGTLWYRRKAALAAFDEASALYRQTVLAAFAQVADTLRALEHDAAALDAQTRAVEAAAQALSLLKTNYAAGTIGYLDILIADRQYHTARIAWLEASAQRLQHTVAFYAALGGGAGDVR